MNVKIVLVGTGGYASFYINELLDNETRGDYEFCGVVDPFFEAKCIRKDEIMQ